MVAVKFTTMNKHLICSWYMDTNILPSVVRFTIALPFWGVGGVSIVLSVCMHVCATNFNVGL